MDAAADSVIHDTLLALPSTVLFICHRLENLHRFDLVLVLAKGAVESLGPFTPELMSQIETV